MLVISSGDSVAAAAAADPVEDVVAARERVRDEIEAELAELCGVLNVAHGRLVRATVSALETGIWKGYGIGSVEHWLSLQAGLSFARAREIVSIASRAAELSVTVGTLAAGELSIDQVVPIAARVPAYNDAEVAELAKVLTVGQVRRVVTRYPFPNLPTESADTSGPMGSDAAHPDRTGPDGAPIDPASRESAGHRAKAGGRVGFGWADDGRFWAHADLPADTGALMEQALREARDRLFRVAGDADETTVVTNADALADVCGRSLQQLSETGRVSRADRYRVYLHLDTDGGWVNAGPTVPRSLLEKLSCDGVVQPVWETDGHPVNVGRTQRIVPARTRRLVEDRDRSCRFPACAATAWLEIHHIVHWLHGGPTDMGNLICLCPWHHDAHHRSNYSISGDANRPETVRFVDADGNPIGPPAPTPPTGPLPAPADGHRWRHPGGERLNLRWISFRPPPDGSDYLN